MRSPVRIAITTVLCATAIGVGYAASPKALPTIEFVTPVGNEPAEVDATNGDDSSE